MTDTPQFVYKITTAGLWERSTGEGVVSKSPIDRADGYMHLSTGAQLPETLALHFAGQRNLVVLALKTETLGAALKWEPSRGGDLFPHLYADLPLTDIDTVYEEIAVGEDGSTVLPEGII